MGKKRIIQQTKEELLAEREKIEQIVKKDQSVKSKKIKKGQIYISSSYNNIVMSLTDMAGNVLAWASAGNIGFKGTKKGTPFAASKVAEVLAQKAQKIGIEEVSIFIKGIGSGRDSAIRSLAARGLNLIMIKDVTPIPHNGCRPRKPRRA